MKPKYGALCIGLILAAVATILLIALPGSVNLYAAYVFCLIGIAMMVAGVWASDDNAPASYALLRQVGWFLPVSLFISVVVLVLQGVGVVTLPVLWHCIVQIIPLAFAGIRIIALYTGKQQIEDVDKRVVLQKDRITAMINNAAALQPKVNAFPEKQHVAAAKALKQVIDGLRYSDPMSTTAVRMVDSEIESGVFLLKNSCNAENATQFVSECEVLCSLLQERNTVLKGKRSMFNA